MNETVFRAAIVYSWVFILGGLAVAVERERVHQIRVAYRAAATLPKNHRLAESDLIIPRGLPRRFHEELPPKKDLAGKYLIEKRKRGDPVTKKDLGDAPSLDAGRGFVVVMFRITEPVVCASLEPGDRIKLYAKEFGPKADYEAAVLAVPGTGAPCSAALAVSPQESDFFLHPKARLTLFERGHR
jgi:hypothetical protein